MNSSTALTHATHKYLTKNESWNISDKHIERHQLRTATQLIHAILILAVIWLNVSLVAYGIKNKKFRFKSKNIFAVSTLYKLSLFTSLLMIPRVILTEVVIYIGFGTGEAENVKCDVIIDIALGVYALVIYTVYFFFWLRQRFLYRNPPVSNYYNAKIKWASWICIIYITISALVVAILYATIQYRASGYGCVIYKMIDKNTVYFLFLAGTATIEMFLFGLFIYPLQRTRHHLQSMISQIHRAKKSQCADMSNRNERSKEDTGVKKVKQETRISFSLSSQANGRSSVSPNTEQPRYNRKPRNSLVTNQRIYSIIRRCAISSTVCVATDILAIAIDGFIFPEDIPKYFTYTMYDVNMFINAILMILQFEDSNKIFLSLNGRFWKSY